MASKLRRTPLFGCDGNLGIPIIPKQGNSNGFASKSQKSSSSYDYKHSSNKMEVAAAVCPTNTPSYPSSGVMSSTDSGNSSANSSVSSSSSISATSRLQNSSRMNSSSSKITSSNNTNHRQQAAAPATPNRHVNFGGGTGEEKKREKFLTAKYGAHQMALIRKRLRVEMWMYERLQELYGADDIEIDLDEVLDMEDEQDRRHYISEILRLDGNNIRMSPDRMNLFVGDLLEKVKTL